MNPFLQKMKILICGILLFLWNHDLVISHRFTNKDPAFCGLFPNFRSTATTPILPFQDVSRRFLSDQIATPKHHLHALGFQDTSCVFGGMIGPQKTPSPQLRLEDHRDGSEVYGILRYHFTNKAVHDLGGGNSNIFSFSPQTLGFHDPI